MLDIAAFGSWGTGNADCLASKRFLVSFFRLVVILWQIRGSYEQTPSNVGHRLVMLKQLSRWNS